MIESGTAFGHSESNNPAAGAKFESVNETIRQPSSGVGAYRLIASVANTSWTEKVRINPFPTNEKNGEKRG